MKFILVPALLTFACAGPRAYQATVPDTATKRVEDNPLPTHPRDQEVPDNIPKGDWVIPLEKGECWDKEGTPNVTAPSPCPTESGIVVSEERAYRDGLYRIGYNLLAQQYASDRTVWSAHRELYEERLRLADRAIQDLQPGWWERNKFQLGVAGGLVLGIAASVAILAATEDFR